VILFNILPSVMFLVIAVWIMLGLDWRLAAGVLVFAPMPALIATRAAPEQTRRERTLLDRWAHIYSRFNEVLSGIMIVRSFAMEDVEKRRFLRDVHAANQVVIRGVATDAGYHVASNLAVALARLWAIGFGGWLAFRGDVTVGTVIAFLGYVGGLFGPVQGLSGIYATLRKASVSLDEIFGILNLQEHLGDSPDAADIASVTGAVTFDDVHFRYGQRGRPLLNGLTLQVEPGQTIAIVGPSGSGKTTLMSLLMRFHDPDHGRISGISASCCRTLCCSTTRSPPISPMRVPTPPMPRSRRRRGRRMPMTSSGTWRTATTRWWASAAACCQRASANASPSPGHC
jgi:ATP-binding cassette subfamily B protein